MKAASLRRVHEAAFEAPVSVHAKVVILFLAGWPRWLQRRWPTLVEIARHCAVSRDTVIRALRELEGARMLRWVSGTYGVENDYELTAPETWPLRVAHSDSQPGTLKSLTATLLKESPTATLRGPSPESPTATLERAET